MFSTARRRRFALVMCGALLLLVAAVLWIERKPAAPGGADHPMPLETIDLPQDPQQLYQHRTSPVRSSLVEAMALDKPVSYARRTELLRATRDDLNGTETDLLLAALLATGPAASQTREHSVWFNEAANLLHRQPAAHEQLARALATVAGDPGRSPLLRDYALQHLRVVWNDSAHAPRLRDSIEASLRWIVGGRGEPAVTTAALLSLHLLGDCASAPGGPVQRPLPDEQAAALAGGLLAEPAASSSPAERMTAARIAADRRLGGLRPALARIAANHAEHALARIAAINALGRIGNPADRPLIESLSSADPLLAAAAEDALKRIP